MPPIDLSNFAPANDDAEGAYTTSVATRRPPQPLPSPEGGGKLLGMEREHVQDMVALSEARTDVKFADLSGKIDRLNDAVARLADDTANVRADIRSARTTTVVTGIASVLAVAGLVASLVMGVPAWISEGRSQQAIIEQQVNSTLSAAEGRAISQPLSPPKIAGRP